MLIVATSRITDPHINLAVEEYLLRNLVLSDPILYFYVNSPSIVIGRNQNVFEEIDLGEVQKQEIPVVRRLSGGGTVYHDTGNLNYSLVSPDQALLNNFADFTLPVICALGELGLKAELRNRSSIFVGNKKVSGNAQYASAGKLVSHGTLLVDSDLAKLRPAIRPRQLEIKSRAIQSVRSPVANLSELMDVPVSIDVVRKRVQENFTRSSELTHYDLDSDDWTSIRKLADERYHSWSWNIGRSPKFIVTRRVGLPPVETLLQISVEKGIVQEISQEGNTLDNELLRVMNICLRGVRYEHEDLDAALQRCDILGAHTELSRAELLDLLIE